MNLGLNLGLGSRRGGGLVLPNAYWGAATGGWLLEARRLDTLFQTETTASPVTTVGQFCGRWNDLSPFANHFEQPTPASRFLYEIVDGFPCLTLDGIDDFMRSITTVNPGTTDKLELFIGVTKLRDSSVGTLIESGASLAGAGSFNATAPFSAGNPNYGFGLTGSASAVRVATTFTAPNTAILSCTFDIAQATREEEILPLVNNVMPTLTGAGGANAGTGNFGTFQHFLGRRNGASQAAQLRLTCASARYGPLLSASERLQAIRYFAAQTPGNLVP